MKRNHRTGRVSEEIKKIISNMIINGIKDPRVSRLTSITDVEVSNDLSYAKVYVSVLGTEKEKKETLEALESASGFIRKEVGSKIKVRHVPEFIFKEDNSLDYSQHISKLIHDIEKDRDKNDDEE
ncbi:MAG: 30S ribosome-binding factor RbfA [Peptostreptococcales bacterium]